MMGASNRFKTLEAMCREKAAQAEREMKYWMEEADEWERLSETSVHHVEDGPLQIDWCVERENTAEHQEPFTTTHHQPAPAQATLGS